MWSFVFLKYESNLDDQNAQFIERCIITATFSIPSSKFYILNKSEQKMWSPKEKLLHWEAF